MCDRIFCKLITVYICIFSFCGSQRIDMVYFTELRSAVDRNLERFLKSCIFYFIRNTKGEWTDGLQ